MNSRKIIKKFQHWKQRGTSQRQMVMNRNHYLKI